MFKSALPVLLMVNDLLSESLINTVVKSIDESETDILGWLLGALPLEPLLPQPDRVKKIKENNRVGSICL